MELENDKSTSKVPVRDKRRAPSSGPAAPAAEEEAVVAPAPLEPMGEPVEGADEQEPTPAEQELAVKAAGYLEDLRRIQAEYANYRRRVMREQAGAASRGSARLVERLLPVLDNFERASSHGEQAVGLELVYKELKDVLKDEGLEEIPADGEPFDPTKHEAVEVIEEPGVAESVNKRVYRKGYLFKGQTMRPAMVVVAHPAEEAAESPPEASGEATAGGASAEIKS